MIEILDEYKNLIINFEPEIKIIDIEDDWTDKIESKRILSSYNGCNTPEDYKYALSDYERIFLQQLDLNKSVPSFFAQELKQTCSIIMTYLYAEIQEYHSNFGHQKMSKNFLNEFDINSIDAFLKEAYESVQRTNEYVFDFLSHSATRNTIDVSKIEFPEPIQQAGASFSVINLERDLKILLDNGISICDVVECQNLSKYLLIGEFKENSNLIIKIDNRQFKLIYDQIKVKYVNITNQKRLENNRFLLKKNLDPFKSSDLSSAIYNENSKNHEKAIKPLNHDLIIQIFKNTHS